MRFDNAASLANGANADNVLGQVNFTSGGGGTSATQLRNPFGVFYDPAADILWAADYGNHRVLTYGTPCSSAITVTSNADSGAGRLGTAAPRDTHAAPVQ